MISKRLLGAAIADDPALVKLATRHGLVDQSDIRHESVKMILANEIAKRLGDLESRLRKLEAGGHALIRPPVSIFERKQNREIDLNKSVIDATIRHRNEI